MFQSAPTPEGGRCLLTSGVLRQSSPFRFCQNSGLIDDGVAIHAGVHHVALTFSINSRQRDMNSWRRADDDAGVLSILK